MSEEIELPVKANTVVPIDKEQLATAEEQRHLSKRGGDHFIKVKFEKITTRPGHNGRTKNNKGFTKESLEGLARSIFAVGLLEPLGVDVYKDGTIILTRGERRWRAIGIIRGWIKSGNLKELFADNDIEKKIPSFDEVECLVNPKSYTEIDRDYAMLAENMMREDLDPMEEAEGLSRLIAKGVTAAEITRRIPRLNAMQVSNRLKLASLSDAEKQLIEEGKISPTAAVKLARGIDSPEERVELIEDAAKGEGGKLKVDTILEQIAENEANENPANFELEEEEANNPLRNSDLVDPIKSGADDDPSMRGTSPKAKPDAKIDGDPAVKSVDQPEVLGDFDDELLKSGTKTAFDLTLKVMSELKELEAILGRDADPRLVTLITSMEKKLYDVKVILKLKKKK